MRSAVERAGLDAEIDSAGTGDWHVGNPPDPAPSPRRAITASTYRPSAHDRCRSGTSRASRIFSRWMRRTCTTFTHWRRMTQPPKSPCCWMPFRAARDRRWPIPIMAGTRALPGPGAMSRLLRRRWSRASRDTGSSHPSCAWAGGARNPPIARRRSGWRNSGYAGRWKPSGRQGGRACVDRRRNAARHRCDRSGLSAGPALRAWPACHDICRGRWPRRLDVSGGEFAQAAHPAGSTVWLERRTMLSASVAILNTTAR